MIDFDEYRSRNQEAFTRKRLRLGISRLPRNRPPDPEGERARLRIALKRREAWIAQGKLVILGPRHYRLNL